MYEFIYLEDKKNYMKISDKREHMRQCIMYKIMRLTQEEHILLLRKFNHQMHKEKWRKNGH